jgi:hypothetical protein
MLQIIVPEAWGRHRDIQNGRATLETRQMGIPKQGDALYYRDGFKKPIPVM